ncbi:MAG TPA: zinc ABC transporter substrate-binding protein [Hyphomicrobiaceae bacterium]|nr:zinc ABC transporter substrate-binding protein [Hyphomicrobiaceae bacterium]
MRIGRRGIVGGLFVVGATVSTALLLMGSSVPANAQARKIGVVATTGMIADAARQVGGGEVEVTALMGPGVDPHAYRQTRSDIAAMTRADLVLWHGLYLEAQMEELLRDLGRRRKVVAVAESLPKPVLRAHDAYKDRFDPHVWMSPELWAGVVAAVRDGLAAAAPDRRAAFDANAARHLTEIGELAAYAKRILATVPADRRVLITAHDAFNYFGAAYGFEVLGIQGISTESEAGLNRIRELVEIIVARRIGAIFVESSVSDRNVKALIEGSAARGHAVKIGGELFSDAMGEAGTYEGTYIGMIDHNVTTIARALGGEAPERGMGGRLGNKK